MWAFQGGWGSCLMRAVRDCRALRNWREPFRAVELQAWWESSKAAGSDQTELPKAAGPGSTNCPRQTGSKSSATRPRRTGFSLVQIIKRSGLEPGHFSAVDPLHGPLALLV